MKAMPSLKKRGKSVTDKRNDLEGLRYGRLVVIERAENYISPQGQARKRWLCHCDCGNVVVVLARGLISGTTRSCGCLQREIARTTFTKHGMWSSRLHTIWSSMKSRCYNEKSRSYKYYGGRGITICDKWLHDFQVFFDWAMANGYKDNLSIDRIDPNGNYCPDNCRWITMAEQQRNKRKKEKSI